MGFHDTNHDGKCTKDEFVTNFIKWSSHEHTVTQETGKTAWEMQGEGEDGDEADGDDEGDGQDEM